MSQRYKFSKEFGHTNFSFGHDQSSMSTLYRDDFTPHCSPTPSSPHCHLVPSCAQCKYTTLIAAFRIPQSKEGEIGDASGANMILEKKKTLQGNHFTFGNDKLDHTTTYKQFSVPSSAGGRTAPVLPPTDSEVLPPVLAGNIQQRSSLKQDFTYFGSNVSGLTYNERVQDFCAIQRLNAKDSVANTLSGKRRKMMTRSMVDYRHPLDRVQGNIKDLMVQQVSPFIRQDSIWSVNSDKSKTSRTETNQNFTWPRTHGIKRFRRGYNNDKVR